MKQSESTYRRALELCGINPKSVVIDGTPINCIDEENRRFSHINGVKWFKVNKEGECIARGWITDMLRVSQYGTDKNLTGHCVRPYGGSWEHPFEKAYQQLRWRAWNAIG